MRFTQFELVSTIAIIVYVAFFTHPPPDFIVQHLNNPVGQMIALIGILFVAMKVSYVVGILLAIAYLVSANPVLEYLDEKEQKPKKEQPKTSAVPAAPSTDVLKSLMKLGERMPQTAGKDVGPKVKSAVPPKPVHSSKEHFASF